MPLWTVQGEDGEEIKVEAALLATDCGALVALSEEGVLMRAWAPGSWCTVRQVTGQDAHPAGQGGGRQNVLVGLPHR
jgi:hypothetical protein